VDRDVEAEPFAAPLLANDLLAAVHSRAAIAVDRPRRSWYCARRRRPIAVDRQDAAGVVGAEPPVWEVFGAEAKTDRMPDSQEPRMASSAWAGEFMMCDQSTSVDPGVGAPRAPHRLPA
jgi:hypothetical protein